MASFKAACVGGSLSNWAFFFGTAIISYPHPGNVHLWLVQQTNFSIDTWCGLHGFTRICQCNDTILVSLKKCFPTPQLSFRCEASSNISSTPGMKLRKSCSSSRSESLNNWTKEYLVMAMPFPGHKGCVLTQFWKPSGRQQCLYLRPGLNASIV